MKPGNVLAVFVSLAVLFAVSCGGKDAGSTVGTDSGTSSSSSSSSSSAGTDGDSGSTDLPPDTGDLCGNGVIDPGEECDDGDGGCDGCTFDCRVPADPGLEWSVSLDPLVEIRGSDMTRAGRAYVVGRDVSGEGVLQVVDVGAIVETVSLADIGITEVIAFHVNAAATDGAEVGILGADVQDARIGARFGTDGLIGSVIPLGREAALATEVVVTSVGITTAVRDEGTGLLVASTTSPSGDPIATFSIEAETVDAFGDRLVFLGPDTRLLDPDGSNEVTTGCSVPWNPGLLPWGILTTHGTHVVSGEGTFDGEALMHSCELVSGMETTGSVAMGLGGFEAAPRVWVRDGAPNGNPLGEWSACQGEYSLETGCNDSISGVGGPGDPMALMTDDCDSASTIRITADRGVHLVRRNRSSGELRFVRRLTFPNTPPWG